MLQNKIVPNLWFCEDGGNISKIIEYYKNIFENDFQNGPNNTFRGNTQWKNRNV